MAKIKDLFKIKKGKKAPESESGIRYIQIEDLRNDFNMKYTPNSQKAVICDKSDILVAWDGANAGTVGYNLEGAIGSTIAKLSPQDSTIDSEYAGRFLQSKFRYLRNTCTGATIPHISRKALENIEIPLPPIKIQRQIASILERADRLRRLNKELISTYEQLGQSLFWEMFGDPIANPKEWDKVKFDELVATECPLTYGIVQPGEEYNEGVPCVRPVDLKSQYLSNKGLKKIDPKISAKFKRTVLNGGELLLSVRGSVGVLSIAEESLKGSNVTRGIVPIWFDEMISNKIFFYYLYKSEAIQREVKGLAKGATLIQINLKDLRELKVIKPPIELQEQFANRMLLLEKQKLQAQQALEHSEELFKSLLQRAFRGELVREKEEMAV